MSIKIIVIYWRSFENRVNWPITQLSVLIHKSAYVRVAIFNIVQSYRFEPKLQVQTKLMHSMYYNHTVLMPTVRSQAEHASYALYAAVVHAGTTLDSGHYYTLAKDSDQWHMYNDEAVSAADEGQLNALNRSSTPYILFYRRADIEEGTALSMEELPPRLQESVMAHNKHYVETVRKRRHNRPWQLRSDRYIDYAVLERVDKE